VAGRWGVARDGDGKTVLWPELGERATTEPDYAELTDLDPLSRLPIAPGSASLFSRTGTQFCR